MDKIIICGASGLVGSALVEAFQSQYKLVLVGRSPALLRSRWKDYEAYSWSEFEAIDLSTVKAIINLAGENIAAGRWTKSRMHAILSSRCTTTAIIAKRCATLGAESPLLINASAIGIYPGHSFTQTFTESFTPSGKDINFPQQVVRDWEGALQPALDAGVTTIMLRFGVIMSAQGGALAKLLPSFKLGLGAVLGSGQQQLSWVALTDVVRVVRFMLESHTAPISGPYNIVARSQTQASFAKELAHVLRKPQWLKLPAPLLICMLGDMARYLLLEGAAISVKKIESLGFEFDCESIQDVIDNSQ